MRVEEFDVVIVGAGLSGLRVGLELVEKWNVAVITKVYPVRSHSGAAQIPGRHFRPGLVPLH